jgi:hypothetical protein
VRSLHPWPTEMVALTGTSTFVREGRSHAH